MNTSGKRREPIGLISGRHNRLSRGIHTAGLGDGQRLLTVAEDLSRHHAMDKIIGRHLMERLCVAGAIVCTTGRLSSGIVCRAYRLSVEVLLSRTSPTALAIELAERCGMTLIGYVRGEDFTVYSGRERVTAREHP